MYTGFMIFTPCFFALLKFQTLKNTHLEFIQLNKECVILNRLFLINKVILLHSNSPDENEDNAGCEKKWGQMIIVHQRQK